MLFSKRKNNLPGEVNSRINNNDIQSVTEFNFLGLYLNSKLNWDTHINVISWLKANRLTLNVNKTIYMLFSKRKNNLPGEINLRINNNDIESVTEFNFLGLYLNSKLSWDTHINVIGKKISRAIGIIKKLKLIFPQKILISLYNTLILPHINYCLLSWGSSNAAECIFLQQKKAIRAISSASHNAHTEPLFKIFNILKLNDIFNYRLLTFYYNLRHNKVPLDRFVNYNSLDRFVN